MNSYLVIVVIFHHKRIVVIVAHVGPEVAVVLTRVFVQKHVRVTIAAHIVGMDVIVYSLRVVNVMINMNLRAPPDMVSVWIMDSNRGNNRIYGH